MLPPGAQSLVHLCCAASRVRVDRWSSEQHLGGFRPLSSDWKSLVVSSGFKPISMTVHWMLGNHANLSNHLPICYNVIYWIKLSLIYLSHILCSWMFTDTNCCWLFTGTNCYWLAGKQFLWSVQNHRLWFCGVLWRGTHCLGEYPENAEGESWSKSFCCQLLHPAGCALQCFDLETSVSKWFILKQIVNPVSFEKVSFFNPFVILSMITMLPDSLPPHQIFHALLIS